MSLLKKLPIFLLILFSLISSEIYSQVRSSLGTPSRLMNNALYAMQNNEYEKANSFFRQIIESDLPIPPEMPYYFALTLFELEQYDNSSNFLNKYIQINGNKGENYANAMSLKQKLEEPLANIRACSFCDVRGYRFLNCSTCSGEKIIEQDCKYCKSNGIVGCYRCLGSGLTKKRNVFNITEFHECTECDGSGRLTCPRCEGSKLSKSECFTCSGHGKLISEEICDHEVSDEPRHFSFGFQKLQELSHN